eukprot:SAG31_NODE_3383_length_4335_cov_2.093012_5_plen_51_part_00
MSHRQLLDTLNAYAVVESDPHLSNLCCRLDYNMYYNKYYSGTPNAAARGS